MLCGIIIIICEEINIKKCRETRSINDLKHFRHLPTQKVEAIRQCVADGSEKSNRLSVIKNCTIRKDLYSVLSSKNLYLPA